MQGCMRRGQHGNRRLDLLATSVDCAARWTVQRRWHPGLSDHAALVGHTNAGCGTGLKPCTPATL
eukprot:4727620-Lingulodinium_polyedra.AAC.1